MSPTLHTVAGVVLLRPGNLSGDDRTFDVLAGIEVAPDGFLLPVTQEAALPAGSRVAAIEWPDPPAQPDDGAEPVEVEPGYVRIDAIYEVRDEGILDVITDDFVGGDLLTISASQAVLPYLAGTVSTIADDGTIAQAGTAQIMSLVPLITGELHDTVGNLQTRVGQLEDTLRQLFAALQASPLLEGVDLPAPTPTDLPIGTPSGVEVPGDLLPAPAPVTEPEMDGVADEPETIEDHQPVDGVDEPDPGPASDAPAAPVPDPVDAGLDATEPPEGDAGSPGIPGQG